MKPFILSIILLLTCGIMLPGCYKDIISPGADPNGPPQPVSFSGDIIPLLNSNCNNSGCHDAIPTKKPALTPDKAYSSLMNGGYVNTIAPHSSSFYTLIKGGAMPPSGTMKAADIQKVLDWIRNGASNN